MANQALQQDKMENATKRKLPGFGTPYKSQSDAIAFAKEIASRKGEVVFYVTTEDNPAKRVKDKRTGFVEKINPFGDKPYTAPKALQDKIDDMKRLLKASPIPEEFLK